MSINQRPSEAGDGDGVRNKPSSNGTSSRMSSYHPGGPTEHLDSYCRAKLRANPASKATRGTARTPTAVPNK